MKQIMTAFILLATFTACKKDMQLTQTPTTQPEGIKTSLSYGSTSLRTDSILGITKKVGDFKLTVTNNGVSFNKTIKLRLLDEFGNVVRTFADITSTTKETSVPFDLPIERKKYFYEYQIIPQGITYIASDLQKSYPIVWEYMYQFAGGTNIVLGNSSVNVTLVGNDTATRSATVVLRDGATVIPQGVAGQIVTGGSYTFPITGLMPNKVYILEINLNNGLYIRQANIRY